MPAGARLAEGLKQLGEHVCMFDEFRTSAYCSCCHERLEKARVQGPRPRVQRSPASLIPSSEAPDVYHRVENTNKKLAFKAKAPRNSLVALKLPEERTPFASGEHHSFSLLSCTSDACVNRLWNRDVNACCNGHVYLAYRMTHHLRPSDPLIPHYLDLSERLDC